MDGVRDEVLVQRMSGSGDERALSELYDRYSGLVYGLGVRFLGDRSLAEDLVQDVFLTVWRKSGSFDPSKASFSTWIYRVTRNRATDLLRRRGARVRIVGEPSTEPGEPDPTEDLSRNFDVASSLSRLSTTHREILYLAYMEGLSQREIARRTNTPLGTVKSRTTAALHAMRDDMSEEQRGPDHE